MRRATILLVGFCWMATLSACDTPTRVGSVCQQDEHCGEQEQGLALECDHQIPGGSCTVAECTLDDPDTLDVAEDESSCPPGSRCVEERAPLTYRCKGAEQTRRVCRPVCGQKGDCPEVIVCADRCRQEGGQEVCSEVCENRMECVVFWSHLPDPEQSPEAAAAAEDPPRACVLYGTDCLPAPEQ